MVVILVEVVRKAYLASIVPVIVNAVLAEHQLVVDIVAFVSKGDFPRSRLGDKQRGKILASWVTRKMRTIAQFGIRDASIGDSQITEVAEPRSRIGSVMEPPGPPQQQQQQQQPRAPSIGVADGISEVPAHEAQQAQPQRNYAALPTGISEMPTHYDDSIGGSSGVGSSRNTARRSDDTPTETRKNHFELAGDSAQDGSPPPVNRASKPGAAAYQAGPVFDSYDAYDGTQDDAALTPPPLQTHHNLGSNMALPSVTGRESLTDGDLRSLPSQQRASGGGGGGLRVANASTDEDDDAADWPQEAIMHMNLAGGDSSRPPQQPPHSPSFPAESGSGKYGRAV